MLHIYKPIYKLYLLILKKHSALPYFIYFYILKKKKNKYRITINNFCIKV